MTLATTAAEPRTVTPRHGGAGHGGAGHGGAGHGGAGLGGAGHSGASLAGADLGGADHRGGDHRGAYLGAPRPAGAAPGSQPWFPPLPEVRPALSSPARCWLAIAAVLAMIGTAAAAVAVVGAALSVPPLPVPDGRYLGSVRANSTLTVADIDDDGLVREGRAVCATLDRRPSTATVLATMHELGEVNGWADDDVAAVVGSAIGAYCPRHIPVLRG